MPFEWDSAKDWINQHKHGISLARFADMDFDAALVTPATTVGDEQRFKFLGEIDGTLWAAVVTYRGNVTRVISLRPASRSERRFYEQAD